MIGKTVGVNTVQERSHIDPQRCHSLASWPVSRSAIVSENEAVVAEKFLSVSKRRNLQERPLF